MQFQIEDITAAIYRMYDLDFPKEMDGKYPKYISLKEKEEIAFNVIQKGIKEYENSGLMFTGRKDSTVLLHLFLKNRIKLPKLFFIDHGQHFVESLKHLGKLQTLWKIKIETISTQKLFNHKKLSAVNLALVKIKALEYIVKHYRINALFTAIRRSEGIDRADEIYFSNRRAHVRIHPLLDFNESDIWEYIRINKLPFNPLYNKGLRSFEEKRKMNILNPKFERDNRDKLKEKEMSKLRALGYF